MNEKESHPEFEPQSFSSEQIEHDPLIRNLNKIIRQAVRVLAILMVLVILWGIGDVV